MFKTLTPTLSILLALIIFAFFTRPQYAEVKRMSAEIDEYEQTVEDYDAFRGLLASLVAEKDATPLADRERLDRMIPNELDATQTLVDLEALARARGVLFGNVVTSERVQQASRTNTSASAPAPLQVVSDDVSFEIIGTYAQVKDFITDVEDNLMLMDIVELSLKATTQDFQQYAVTVRTYALPKP